MDSLLCFSDLIKEKTKEVVGRETSPIPLIGNMCSVSMRCFNGAICAYLYGLEKEPFLCISKMMG